MPWRVFLASAWMHMRLSGFTGSRFMNVVLHPLLLSVLTILMLRDRINGPNAYFAIIGTGMACLWSELLMSSSWALHRQRQFGTLELIVGSPTPLEVVVSGAMLGQVLLAMVSVIVSFAVAMSLLGVPAPVAQPVPFLVSVLLGVIGLIATGMLIAPLMAISRSMVNWLNALDYPVWILAGFLFPVSLLPDWTTPFSYALAPYWIAWALQASATSGTAEGLPLVWTAIAALTVVYLASSALLFRVVLRRARATAELSLM